jgi:hypothetical protein
LNPPKKLSWANRYFDWIERLPIPTWLFYLLLLLLTSGFSNLAFWIEGRHPWFTFTAFSSVGGIWLPTQQGFTHWLLRGVKPAMESFRPAMKRDKAHYDRILSEMSQLPASSVRWITILLFALVSVIALTVPDFLGRDIQSNVGKSLSTLGFATGFLFGPIQFYTTYRIIVLASEAYTLSDKINLFKLQPLYALSTLSAKAGISLSILAPLNYLQNIILSPYGLGPGFVIGMTTLGMSLAFGAFLIPLWATHIRIVQEKDRQLARNGEQLSVAVDKLGQMNDSGQLEDVDLVDTSIGALIRVRESIKQTSTWPWEASTLRGLLSAVMLPIFLFVVQQILTRFL